MSEMTERVALAIASTYHSRPVTMEYVLGEATGGHVFVEAARAAIEVMREPDSDMRWAAAKEAARMLPNTDRGSSAAVAFARKIVSGHRAMIDAALA